jgi:hypothetical protein
MVGVFGQYALAQRLNRLCRSFHSSSACACRVRRGEVSVGRRGRGREDKGVEALGGDGVGGAREGEIVRSACRNATCISRQMGVCARADDGSEARK